MSLHARMCLHSIVVSRQQLGAATMATPLELGAPVHHSSYAPLKPGVPVIRAAWQLFFSLEHM